MRSYFRALSALAMAGVMAAEPPPGSRRPTMAASQEAWQLHAARTHAALASLQQGDAPVLPAPAPGVTDLSFAEFFGPIGDRGLEYSARIRALHGHEVRLVGYMVREQEHTPGLLLLAAWPVTVQTKGSCTFDDAPPTVVHAFVPVVPGTRPRLLPYRPGRLILQGRLEIGPRPEADGRNSTVRLFLDAASAAQFSPAPPSP